MQRIYKKPTMIAEQFVPNEYVAACGDSGTVYKFKCDAGEGWPGTVYLETNGQEGLQIVGRNPDKSLGIYYACGTLHEASVAADFLPGYYRPALGSFINVIVWRGPNNNDVHCTKTINKDEWETAKS